jgi:hypothetical protein
MGRGDIKKTSKTLIKKKKKKKKSKEMSTRVGVSLVCGQAEAPLQA